VCPYCFVSSRTWSSRSLLGSRSHERTADNTELETTVRALVRANSEKDLPAMSKLMAHDAISPAIPSEDGST